MSGQWADRGPSESVHCPATPAEEKIFEELAQVWLPAEGRSVSEVPLFPYTLLKSFLSSHTALSSTVETRIKTLEKKNDPDATGAELAALQRLRELTAGLTAQDSAKFAALVEQLKAIGVGPRSETRVVVFSERVQTLEWLRSAVPAALGFKGKALKEAARVMHGGLSDEQQMSCVEDFGLADAPVRILFTGDVASEGVNLHRQCHQLIHYDVPWSLIRIEQRNGRIDRYGQVHKPQFRALILTSEVDGAKDDRTVAERLLEREDEAHRSLGTAETVSGLYRAETEEGLEYQRMVIAGVRDGLVPREAVTRLRNADAVRYRRELQRARSLLFVAATRSRDSLAIFWHGRPSPFLEPLMRLPAS
ncbi:C-terminal helicase domain-containing protein [Streptomyces sp. NPDC001880]